MEKTLDNLSILVLNIVSENDKIYGYTICKELQKRGVFISHQIIYRATSKLLNKGLVCQEIQTMVGQPDRNLYSLTKMGRSQLAVAIPTNRGKDTTTYVLAMLYPKNIIYVTWAMAREQAIHNKLKMVLATNDINMEYAQAMLFESTHRLENIKHLAMAHEKK